MKFQSCSILSLFIGFSFVLGSCTCVLQLRSRGLGAPKGFVQNSTPDEWFEQKLDHFTPSDLSTWRQRYQTNSSFYKPGGPVFLMVGGEGEIRPIWMQKGAWILYAQKYNAYCFQLEHRYYGKSKPTEDTSVKNLVYLSSEQALADIAYFITSMNRERGFPPETKWILFGGSYPGSLAAWVRLKYPFLVYGAVSSSGPLLAKVDFREYFEVVSGVLSDVNKYCASRVRRANKKILNLLESNSGRKYLHKKFRLCDVPDNLSDEDRATLFQGLSDNIASVVQYNKDNRASSTANVTVDTVCQIMTNKSAPPIVNYADLNQYMLNVTNGSCVSYRYKDSISEMRKVDWDDLVNQGSRQWMYQSCTEFGFFSTSSEPYDLFGPTFPVKHYIKFCEDVYGKRYDNLLLGNVTERTNIFYGERSIDVGNLIFVHGSVDPWHALGITECKPNKRYHVFFIEGTAHCANMYPPADNDLPQLAQVRQNISLIIGKWLEGEDDKPGCAA